MKILLIEFTVLVSILLSGCITPPAAKTPIVRISFPENEYAQLKHEGTAIIRGQAFLKTRGGNIKYAAGEIVTLNPVTTYSQQWFVESVINSNILAPYDPRLNNYIRVKIADASGNFKFTNVPAGEYYLNTKVTWEIVSGYKGNLEQQGLTLVTKVKVNEAQEIEVILTR